MDDESDMTVQLLEQVSVLQQRVSELEAREDGRQRAREALRQSEETARALLNASNDSALLLEPDGTIIAVNQRCARQLGADPEELVGKNVFDLFPPPLSARRKAYHDQVIRTRQPLRYEDERAGTWFDNSVFPILVRGQVARLAVFAHDISERKRADEALRKKTHEQERLLETARHLTASLDLKEVLTRIGTRAYELLDAHGCTIYLLEPDGRTLKPVVAVEPAFEEEILAAAIDVDASFTGKAVKARHSMVFNDTLNDPSGYQIPGTPVEEEERIIVSPFIVDDEVVGAMCLNRLGRSFTEEDLSLAETFASYAETALKNARTHAALQQEVQERNRAEEALRQSLLELHLRNEELDAFAHTVAHDLQNPLSIIIGMAQVVGDGCESMSADELRDHLGVILQSGYKMNLIIDELMLLAQVRRGQVVLSELEMDIIVAEARQRLEEMIEQYGAEIQVPDKWPQAFGYGPWVEQIWVNYLSNAIKYGGRPPRVEIGAMPQSDGSVRFWVKDNGAGLTPEQQARLFTPFTRLDQVRASGQGLGLSIVRRVVDKLGGRVAVESDGLPGQGCVFSFTLPSVGNYDDKH
jgi:PAS domain S-box-containing protein